MKLLLLLSLLFSFASAVGSGLDEKLGESVPLNLKFITSSGEEKTLKELMKGKPTLLTLNYYTCSGICTIELNNLAATLSKLELKEGEDYQVVTVSFAKEETVELAKHKRRTILRSISRPFNKSAWSFVLDDNGSSQKIADAVGFHFKLSSLPSASIQYTHDTGVIALSPTGKITRYLRSVNQLPIDVKMALIDAEKERVTPAISKQLQSCSAYHPTEKYIVPTEKIVGTLITVLSIILFIVLFRTSKKNRGSLTKEEYYRQEEEKERQEKENKS